MRQELQNILENEKSRLKYLKEQLEFEAPIYSIFKSLNVICPWRCEKPDSSDPVQTEALVTFNCRTKQKAIDLFRTLQNRGMQLQDFVLEDNVIKLKSSSTKEDAKDIAPFIAMYYEKFRNSPRELVFLNSFFKYNDKLYFIQLEYEDKNLFITRKEGSDPVLENAPGTLNFFSTKRDERTYYTFRMIFEPNTDVCDIFKCSTELQEIIADDQYDDFMNRHTNEIQKIESFLSKKENILQYIDENNILTPDSISSPNEYYKYSFVQYTEENPEHKKNKKCPIPTGKEIFISSKRALEILYSYTGVPIYLNSENEVTPNKEDSNDNKEYSSFIWRTRGDNQRIGRHQTLQRYVKIHNDICLIEIWLQDDISEIQINEDKTIKLHNYPNGVLFEKNEFHGKWMDEKWRQIDDPHYQFSAMVLFEPNVDISDALNNRQNSLNTNEVSVKADNALVTMPRHLYH